MEENYNFIEIIDKKYNKQVYVECEILPRIGELVIIDTEDSRFSGQVVDINHLFFHGKIHQIKVYIE